MKRQSILVLTIFVLALLPGTAWSGDKVPPLKQALGAAFLAKAELALLKGQLNRGKVYLAAAHEADPSISVFRLKAFDMMYKDFPYRPQGLAGYFRYRAIACSMDERFVAYTSSVGLSRLDLETGEVKSVGQSDLRWSGNVELSPKGRFAGACYNDGKLTLCDMAAAKVVGEHSFRKEPPLGLTTICMSFSPDEKLLVAYYEYSDQEGIHFFRTKDLSLVKTMPAHGRVRPVKFLPDGSLLLGMNGRCQLVDPESMLPIKTLARTSGWDVDYLPNKNLLAVGGWQRIEV